MPELAFCASPGALDKGASLGLLIVGRRQLGWHLAFFLRVEKPASFKYRRPTLLFLCNLKTKCLNP